MPDEILAGNLRGLVLAGGNPMRAIPNPVRTRQALARLDVLALADVREIEVMDLATHVLPVTGQLERADTSHPVDQFLPVTAGRYTPAVVAPQAERRAMWWVFAALGERMDHHLLAPGQDLATATDDDLLRPQVERGRGGSMDTLQERRVEIAESPFGWVEARLLSEGRYQLWHPELAAQLARLHGTGGLRLIPRRQRRHLNSQMSEFQSGNGRHDSPDLLINPFDAEARGLADGATAVVTSPAGSVRATVRVDAGIASGAVSLAHGWEQVNVEAVLSTRGTDALTGMPVLSGVTVEVAPA
jgi:anaerobic selenocysteine-containing dehydrogenase